MKDFFRRLFARKATEAELVCGYAKIEGGLRFTRNQIKEQNSAMLKKMYELQKQVSRLERHLNNSFVLVEGKDLLREEAGELESELYGRDASESKELHDKLVRVSVIRAKLRDKSIPEQTYYQIVHRIIEELPEGGLRYEPKEAVSVGGKDGERLRVLQTSPEESNRQADEEPKVP